MARDSDATIAEYGVLDQALAPDLQPLVDLAAMACAVPFAAINLITSTHQHQVATAGIDPSVCERPDSMCAAVLTDRNVVAVEDASTDPRFSRNPFVTGDLGAVRFYASTPLTAPDGSVFGRLCVFDDVPHALTGERARVLEVLAARVVDLLELRLRSRELEQSLAELTEARDQLRRSNEVLAIFAGQVSHDLRTPLTAVLANAELLLDESVVRDNPVAAQLARGVVDAGRRMSALIESTLASTRVGAPLDIGDADLQRLLEHVVGDLAPALTARGGKVSGRSLPRVRANVGQLYAVLLNLVSNAVKYVPAGIRPEVEVSACRDGDEWRVTVSDNGSGIPPEQRERVFGLYVRGNHEDGSLEGSGIGLATARRIVEAHGGRIGVDSASTGGAAVWFTLPA